MEVRGECDLFSPDRERVWYIWYNAALVCSKLFQMSRFLTHNPVAEVTLMYMFGIMSYVIG